MTHHNIRIFIIDDEECIRDSFAMHLSSLGYQVETFSSPTACPALNGHKCEMSDSCTDILIIDQNMPELAGIDYLKLLVERRCKVKPKHRIMLSGKATPDLAAKVTAMGGQIYQKPLLLDQLEEIVESARKEIEAERSTKQAG